MTSSRLEYTKTPPQTGGSSYILIEKSPKAAFLYIKQYMILIHFVKTRSRIKNILLQAILSCISQKFRESYTSTAIGLGLRG
jgi:hypothetical protein